MAASKHRVVLGKFLAKAREKAGKTQKDVATAMGWSTAQFVSNFERGVVYPVPGARLALVLGLRPRDLIDAIYSCKLAELQDDRRGALKAKSRRAS